MAFPFFFFFNYTATTEIYPLSLHDALPIFRVLHRPGDVLRWRELVGGPGESPDGSPRWMGGEPHPSDVGRRSEEHTSELQSQSNLVCRLLLEKKSTSSQLTTSASACRLLQC